MLAAAQNEQRSARRDAPLLRGQDSKKRPPLSTRAHSRRCRCGGSPRWPWAASTGGDSVRGVAPAEVATARDKPVEASDKPANRMPTRPAKRGASAKIERADCHLACPSMKPRLSPPRWRAHFEDMRRVRLTCHRRIQGGRRLPVTVVQATPARILADIREGGQPPRSRH